MNKLQVCILMLSLLANSLNLSAKDYLVTNYGAIPDGKTLNTKSIQDAVDQAHKDGGGRVVIPSGQFLSGSIILKSNVELHLKRKAVLLGSTNPEHYRKINRWKALVMGDHIENVAITGKGVLDGQGCQLALFMDSLFYAGEIDSSKYVFPEMRPVADIRPQIIEFMHCNKVRVTGVTVQNAASWVQSYERCNGVVIDKIRVESDTYWNNDGIDIIDSKNVRITNCYVNASDDGICLKSFRRHAGEPEFCDSVYIGNCRVRSSANAVKLGTSSYGGFKNVTIEKIKVFDTYRSAIAIENYETGILENILVQNIKAVNTGNAIFIRLGHRVKYYYDKTDVGILRNVVIRNVKVKVPFKRPDYKYELRGPALPFFHNVFPSSITGIPGHPVQNITLENITIIYPGRGNKCYAYLPLSRLNDVPEQIDKYPEFSMFGELPAWGFYVRHVDGLSMKNIKIKIRKPDYRPAFVFDDTKNLQLMTIKIKGDKKPNPVVIHPKK